MLAFEENGVRYAVGNYDYYLEKRAAEVVAGIGDPGGSKTSSPAGVTDPGYNRTRPRKLKYKEERELEGMEAAILAAEEEVSRLEAVLGDPEFFASRAAEFSK